MPPLPALRRIDHLICEVPDIAYAFRHFTEALGFPAAWPIGRFWPTGLTAGVGLGGINLEFIQLDQDAPAVARISTIVFEPTSIEAAIVGLEAEGFDARLFEKWESDTELLALRGYPPEMRHSPQLICRNVLVDGQMPIPFFLCDYSEFQRLRLALGSPHGQVRAIHIQANADLFRRLGYSGDIEITGEDKEKPPLVTEIRLETGSLDLKGFPAEFRFA